MTSAEIPKPVAAFIARIGLGARAFVYFAVSIILIDSALTSKPDDGASPGDAFRAIETEQGGRIVLIALAAGLFLYALWRFQQAALDPENHGRDAKGILSRIGMAMSGMSYLLIGIAAFAVTFGSNSGGGGGKTAETARWLMKQPYGRWMVLLAGVALIAIGCAQIWRVKSDQWQTRIDLSGWAARTKPVIEFGIAGRGILFMMVGGFIAFAGASADASDVKGLAQTIGWIRYQPFGFWLFLVAALSVGAYGVYSAVQSARYKIPDS